jgi:hypothetical protein
MLVSTSLAYNHYDYVKESDYHGPALVNDTLLDDCHSLDVPEIVCNTTESGNLSREQAKQLILDSMNPSLSGLDYGFVDGWNRDILFSKYPPDGVPSYSSGSIRDAWVKIVSFQPSMRSGNQMLLNQTGTIRSEFAFTYVLPDKPASGDCETYYSAKGYNYTLNTTLNGLNINKDDSRLVTFNLSNSSNLFQTNLSIESGYQASHYVWVTHCSKHGGCYKTCEYAYTENVTNRLNISDSVVGVPYNFTYNISSFVDSNFSGLMNFWLEYNVTDDFGQILFNSGNSSIRVKGADYRLRYDYAPYNILSYEIAGKDSKTYLKDASLLFDNQSQNGSNITRRLNAILDYSDDCSLTFASHFNVYTSLELCNITNETSIINLSIAGRTNESISLLIHVYDNISGVSYPNKDLILRYGSSEQIISTNSQGFAQSTLPLIGNHVITAEFPTDLKNKSAKAVLFIPEELPEPDTKFWSAITGSLAISLLYKLSRSSITNAMA